MLRSFRVPGGGALGFVLLLAVAAGPALTAQGEKQIDCGTAGTYDAVVITRVTVGNTVIPCMWAPGPPNGRGQYQPAPPFQGDDDWLQKVTIYLFNRTSKTIVWAAVHVGFPQTGDGWSPGMSQRTYEIVLGIRPAVANFSHRTGQQMPQQGAGIPLSFPGGQTTAIALSDHIDRIQDRIRDRLFVPVTKISIMLTEFVFDDGMHWNPGNYSVPDQEHPGNWTSMPDGYFPGNVRANWPPDRIRAGRD